MHQEGDHFAASVFPKTRNAILERLAPRRSPLPWLGWLALPAACALALLLVHPGRPAPDYVGVKGPSLGFGVFVGGQGPTQPVFEGGAVPASAALRFRVQAAEPCRLWVISVDSTGQVSRLFPAEGEGGAPIIGGSILPGGALLDGHPGPERLFAICSPTPITFKEVEAAAKSAIPGGEVAVRKTHEIPGFPRVSQASTLLEKGL